MLCVDAGRAGRGGSGVDGWIPRRRGGSGGGDGADEAETKVSSDEEEVGRRSFSARTIRRGDSLSGAEEDFFTYCAEEARCCGFGFTAGGPFGWEARVMSSSLDRRDNIFCDEARLGWGERMAVLALATATDRGGVDARAFLFGSAALVDGDSSTSFFVDLGGGGVGGGLLDSSPVGSLCGSCFSPAGPLAGAGEDTGLSRAGGLANISGGLMDDLVTTFRAPGGVTGRGFGFGLGLDTGGLLLLLGVAVCFLTGSVSSSLFSNIEIRAFVDGNGTASAARSKLVTEVAALCVVPVFPPCCLLTVC